MYARFDALNTAEQPTIFVCSPGCTCTNGILSHVSGVLPNPTDMEFVFNWNSTSELNFRVYKITLDDEDDNRAWQTLYKTLKNRRLLYADEIGFFVITEVEEEFDGKSCYKDIKANSVEIELQEKELPYIEDGTYMFYTGHLVYKEDGSIDMAHNPGESEKTGLLDYVLSRLRNWTVDSNTIPPGIKTRCRTFEDVSDEENVLNFLLEEMQDAYECIFEFDASGRVITVFDQSTYTDSGRMTDIHITKEDLISNLNVRESSDDLYTAISVLGDGDLSINAVNPLGTNVIYNFSYYTDWMSPGLGEKVEEWQEGIASVADEYYELNTDKYELMTELSDINAEITKLNTQLEMYKKCKENIVAESSDKSIEDYNDIIKNYGIDDSWIIPTEDSYTWVKFALDDKGTGITSKPFNMPYIGLSYNHKAGTDSISPEDFRWSTFRDGSGIPETDDENTTYTWVVFADGTGIGMSDEPEDKTYIGLRTGNESATKSGRYSDYAWMLINADNGGIPAVLTKLADLIDEAQATLDVKTTEETEKEDAIAEIDAQISEIHDTYAMNTYFSTSELDELANYIYEGSYSDEYISITDSMSQSERLLQMKLLYDRGVEQLVRISEPTQEFDVDVQNFVFAKEFSKWADELVSGCLVNVEIADDDIASLFLSTITINYADKTLNLTFGNRYNRYDPKKLFEDVLGSVKRSSNTLSYVKDVVQPVKEGAITQMRDDIEMSKTLTKNAAMSSANQQVVIDDTGYTGRSTMDDGSFDPHQIKINGRNIVFTDDAWDTCKTAIGQLILAKNGETETAYGINADMVIGNMIVGNNLKILNANGEEMFVVTENEIRATMSDVAKDEISAPDGYVKTTIEATAAGLTEVFETYKEETDGTLSGLTPLTNYIQVGKVGKDEQEKDIIGVKIFQAGDTSDRSMYSIFKADRISFYSGDNEVAFLSTDKLHVTTARMEGMEFASDIYDTGSDLWRIVTDDNGGIYYQWAGGSEEEGSED